MSEAVHGPDENLQRQGLVRGLDRWWEDFVMDDWVWVSQKVTADELWRNVEGLLHTLRGELVGQVQGDFFQCGEPFELGDPVIQETVWGAFLEALNRVSEFGESIRAYHRRMYPPHSKGKPGVPGGNPQ